MPRPLILGHRGSPFEAPENTLRSFTTALARGADGVELDVRLCKTGELIVCHDATLARLAGVEVRIAQSSAWSLRQWDLGDGDTVPTLDSVLRALPTAMINVEIKTDDGDPWLLARAVAQSLESSPHRGAIVVSSFDPDALVALRAIAPDVRRGLLLSDDPHELADTRSRSGDVLPYSVHPHHTLCDERSVAAWHAVGLRVFAWTVDDREVAERLAGFGVDGLIGNAPGNLVRWLELDRDAERQPLPPK